jgi:Replication-relaxation
VGRGFGGGEGSGLLVPHEAGPGRDRRRQGRPDLGPALGARSQLSDQQADRPPAGGQRVLLRPRRGLQGPPGALPGYLAARALGQDARRGVKPDGFGRYLHPGGACEFYLEYDRATEASRALSRKLEGYLKLAVGWTGEQELTGFPNLLVLVPEEEREGEVATAYRSATTSLHVAGSLASSFPLYVASEDRLTQLGVLGMVWRHLPTEGERLPLIELPARPRDLYRTDRCLGRYFTDADPSHRRRISPASATPRFRALPPRHAP